MTEFLFISAVLMVLVSYVGIRVMAGPQRIYLPDSFVAMVTMHFIGALWLHLSMGDRASSFVLDLSGIAAVSAIAFGCLLLLTTQRSTHRPSVPSTERHYTLVLLVVIVANAGIVWMILQNANIRMLLLLGTTTDEAALLSVRKIITASVDGYMGAGIIKLVRDIASPIAIAAFILVMRMRNVSPFRLPVFWAAVAVVTAAMFLGGQRFPMVLLLCVVLIASNSKIDTSSKSGRSLIRAAIFGILILLGYALMTSALGRNAPAESQMWTPVATVVSLLERVFTIVPREAIKTYSLWSEMGPTFGQSWWADLSTLTPGRSESSFSSELHMLSGGSAEGNAPLFFGADAWLAFGTIGVIMTSALFLLLYWALDSLLWKYRSPAADAGRYLMAFSILLMYSPFLILLNGGLIIIPLIVLKIAATVVGKRSGLTNASFHLSKLRNP